jgi:hypothetical protein
MLGVRVRVNFVCMHMGYPAQKLRFLSRT